MITWLDFVIATLAASAIVDVWQNGSIFAEWRAVLQALSDTPVDQQVPVIEEQPQPDAPRGAASLVLKYMPAVVAELMMCPFCLSHHTTWVVFLLWVMPKYIIQNAVITTLWAVPMYALAATRLGNIVNGLLPENARYNR